MMIGHLQNPAQESLGQEAQAQSKPGLRTQTPPQNSKDINAENIRLRNPGPGYAAQW